MYSRVRVAGNTSANAFRRNVAKILRGYISVVNKMIGRKLQFWQKGNS